MIRRLITKRVRRTATILLLLGFCVYTSEVNAGDPNGIEFFEKKIRPVLVKHCYKCHSADSEKVKGGLLLDTKAGLLKGGDSGAAVVQKSPKKSLLISALQYDGLEMPPAGKLPAAVIADFEKWIAMGAPDPRDGESTTVQTTIDFDQARRFWSFQKPIKPAVPQVGDTNWPRNNVDRFVLSRLEADGLEPVVDTPKETLIRRVYFDLVGLPPSPEEVETFVDDSSQQAFAHLVDRLLASPRFGERWGRHWLDLARFTESNGGDRNVILPHAWRYRNYVIDSFNSDKPYNQFIVEQIAGDLLPSNNSQQRDKQLIATGFLTLGPKLFMETKAERFKLDVVDEQIDVISRSVLGLTVGCARCHDHKFDPIPSSDYYAMAGILESTYLLYGTAAPAGNQYGHDRPLQPIGKDAAKLQGPAELWKKSVADQISKRNKARSDRYRIVRKRQAQKNKLKMAQKGKTKEQQAADKTIKTLTAEIETLAVEIKEWDEKIKKMDKELKQLEDNPPLLPDYAMAVRDTEKPADTSIRIRGEYNKHGKVVPRGFLTVLTNSNPINIEKSKSGRLELANSLTSPNNPLTARVAVNRIWQHLFGEGLVRSVDNFGLTGEQPTHPPLFDYLAVRFMEQGWSVKQIIREIVLSRTYQLSSSHHVQNYAIDPGNRLLWRMNQKRLEAEPLRDAILTLSRELDLNRPDGSVMSTFKENELNSTVKLTPEKLDSRHRSVYLPIARMSLPELLSVFDFADPSLMTGKRVERTMPSQQLFLMNSPFVLEQSKLAAQYLLAKSNLDDTSRVELAYMTFLSRRPSKPEQQRVLQYLKQSRDDVVATQEENSEKQPSRDPNMAAWANFCQSLFASAEFRYLD